MVLVTGIEACKAPTPQKLNSEIKRIEDSIKSGNTEAAKHMIAQHMNETKDSDLYYRWLSVQNRVWYAEMNADLCEQPNTSLFIATSRHTKSDPQIDIGRME